jgi:signal transduction histidine kinase
MIDPDKIRRVFLNLIENAIRYGKRVRVDITGDGRSRSVSVSDNGPGIAPQHLERIFEKFYRITEDTRPGKGSGLGLPIAKDIVEAHGGRVWAESRKGEGSTIHFTLKDGSGTPYGEKE